MAYPSCRRLTVAGEILSALLSAGLAVLLTACLRAECLPPWQAVIGARGLIGFMQGIGVMNTFAVRRITPREEQVTMSMGINFAWGGGVCFGPLLLAGLAISGVFGVAAVLSLALTCVRNYELLTDGGVLMLLLTFGLIGAAAFFGDLGAAVILSGDCLMYPCTLSISCLANGWVYESATDGTWYSNANLVLLTYFLDSLGKVVVLPLARAIIKKVWQNCYAAMQMGLCLVVAKLAMDMLKQPPNRLDTRNS
eukprot:CAMPEP_0179125758 /NCGR_PEP_ID=MMETSP0796-20121207/59495_1 /TAXON_ID=73915 /ORGANISM="Pyrodinium bahamense, Strain pbaha01" /LENGTH=251 /DNA_ID=CAMNT_0020824479 /DNA_START=54 /DNA_END=809 /DNA_ORIENTATION=+